MDLKTFKKHALRLPVDISVFVRGPHGSGKSDCVYDIAEKLNLPVMQRRLSQLTEGDLIGLPNKVEQKNKRYSEFLPMEWFVDCMDKPYLIFLDEIDRALPEVIQAAFELCYDRCIQGKKIHKDCRIYAAGNSGSKSSIYQVNILDPAFLSRFWIVDFEPTVEEWLSWARETGDIHKQIIEFIEDEEEHLEMSSNDKLRPEYIYPSRRSWHRLSRTLTQKDFKEVLEEQEKKELLDLCTGFVGLNASAAFIKHFTTERIRVDDVLNRLNDVEHKISKMGVERQSALIQKLYRHSQFTRLTDEQIENVIGFLFLLPDELRMVLNDYMTRLGVHQENAQRFVRKSGKILEEMLNSNNG